MAILLDLSNELLLQIIAYLSTDSLQLRSLSPSCKRLNACCGYWIFKKYHLSIRTDFPRAYTKRLTPLDNRKTLKSWDLDAVVARLHHLHEKGPYIEELVIEDRKDDRDDEPGVLPECIMPNLLDTLKELSKVTVITISCDCGTLPLPLWEWITTKDLTKLTIGTQISPPTNAMIHPSVREFKGGLYEESMPFLELVRPEKITLTYWRSYNKQPPIASYKPSASHNPQLRTIVLDVRLSEDPEKPLFDFSGVPAATIDASFALGVECKFQVPIAWNRLKTSLPMAFAEDLSNYDVRRVNGAHVTRPALALIEAGWKPSYAAHLEGEAAERAERQQMVDYYRAKSRQWSRQLMGA